MAEQGFNNDLLFQFSLLVYSSYIVGIPISKLKKKTMETPKKSFLKELLGGARNEG